MCFSKKALLLGLWVLALSCDTTDPYGDIYDPCVPGWIECRNGQVATCNAAGNEHILGEVCSGYTDRCLSGLGCVHCEPGDRECQGHKVIECNADGTDWELAEVCGEEQFCHGGQCGGDCARAAVFASYEGCEYRAVTMMNSQVPSDFAPAIVVSNRNGEAVEITVERGREQIATATVNPQSTATIELPWVRSLKGDGGGSSANVDNGSFTVETSLPVTVYQFNPLEYGLPRDCVEGDVTPNDSRCFSFTNDASLLLPVSVLTSHYIVMSRPNMAIRVRDEGSGQEAFMLSPSVFAVVNPQDHPVTVDITFSAPVAGGLGLASYDAGEQHTFTINPGGVLQLAAASPAACTPDFEEAEAVTCGSSTCRYGYCDLQNLDLTGTEIVGSEPVAVFGGHDCTFIPYNRWACDHLEEQLFPYETWGQRYVLSQSHREQGEPDVFRILSGSDDNTVRFSPAVHEEVVLNRGEHVELEAHGAFEVSADRPILVGQFLVGQSYTGFGQEQLPPGDPAFALAVPVEQYRPSYNFLAPSTYDQSYVNVIATFEALPSIVLDGHRLEGESWEQVGETEYWTLRYPLRPGSHSIGSETAHSFGITIYGYGQYTSYMFPGGLDLEPIAVW